MNKDELTRTRIERVPDFRYSELEISRKREALEKVLTPYKMSESINLLSEAGYSHAEDFFRWYNFSGLFAIKN